MACIKNLDEFKKLTNDFNQTGEKLGTESEVTRMVCKLQTMEGDLVYIGHDHDCKVVGIGSVCLKLEDNREILLREVRHVPKLRRNLISLGMLADQDCYISNKDELQIKRAGKIILFGKRVNGLYYLLNVSFPNIALLSQANKSGDFEIWHKRLSHISEQGLLDLSKQGLIQAKGTKRLNFCAHCVYGKAKRLKFTKGIRTYKKKLNYIHANLWGPAES